MTIKLSQRAFLTDEHASASYGQAVLVVDGNAYGPEDLMEAKSGIIPARIWARLEAAVAKTSSRAEVRYALKQFARGGR